MYRSTPVVAVYTHAGCVHESLPMRGWSDPCWISHRGSYRGTAPFRGVVWVSGADCRLCCSTIYTSRHLYRSTPVVAHAGCAHESLPMRGWSDPCWISVL